MTGDFSGAMPESGAGDDVMGLLKNLGREEILEVLSEGEGFCRHCQALLQTSIRNLINSRKKSRELSVSSGNSQGSIELCYASSSSFSLLERSSQYFTKRRSRRSNRTPQPVYSKRIRLTPQPIYSKRIRKRSTPEPVYSGIRKTLANSSPASMNRRHLSFRHSSYERSLKDGHYGVSSLADKGLSEEEEHIRFAQIGRKKDFVHLERIDGKAKNVLQGLELHTRVFNAEEQKKIVEYVYNLQHMGQNGQLRERTYSEPRKWMRGKGRVTIQFGCCYNYAVDKNGNPPGIIRDEEVDPLPSLFKQMIKRMVKWHVMPPDCVPDSCIVNIYDEGDCIPPHIDHHDFVRPFCTVSLLTECNIVFGANLKIVGPGEFIGPVSIPLPVGSVLVLKGNGADVAKHCVPGVPTKRISITFRKMDDNKQPYRFSTHPELMGIKPIVYSPLTKSPDQQNQQESNKISHHEPTRITTEAISISFFNDEDDFPPHNSFFYERDDFSPHKSFSRRDDFPPPRSLDPANRRRTNRNSRRQQRSGGSFY